MDPYYEYRQVVGFEETDLVGNVYYTNNIRWQGRCREMFFFEEAPGALEELPSGLKLFTINPACEYVAEISAFDVIPIRIRLEELAQTQVGFAFDYVQVSALGRYAQAQAAAGAVA